MTINPPAFLSGRRPLALLAVCGVVVVGIAVGFLYGMTPRGGKEGDPACAGAVPVLARLAPYAKGEVAAMAIDDAPRRVPDLVFSDAEGAPRRLADFQGKTVLLNLWATWCVPCRKEMPALDALQRAQGGADFQVLAINIDTARLERPKAYLKEIGVAALGHYADSTANVFQVLRANGKVAGLPTTLLIDKHGCELGVLAGPAEWGSPDATALVRAAIGG